MSMLTSVLLLLIQHEMNYCETVTDGTELVLAFMVHRHGDRSPTTDTIPFGKDPDKIEDLTKPYGYGQLTEIGLQRSYELGKFIRRRYDKVLSPKYNRSEIFIRSTDSTRAKMTTLAAMAAVYPPERRWEPELNWTPTPYTIIPAKYDYGSFFVFLSTAPEWNILMDTYEKHYKIPEDMGVSTSRSELTIPWETNIPKDHTIKLNKYYNLTNKLTKNGYVVNLYAVKVGARGIPAKSLYNLLKDLGLSRTANLAELSCPTLTKAIANTLHFNSTEMAEYEDIYKTLRRLGYMNVNNPLTICFLYDLLISLLGIGVPLEPEIEDVFPRMKEAAGKVWDIIYGNKENLSLHTGVLLKEFFDIADSAVSGKRTQRVRIQSGHDATVYPFIAATHVRPRPGPLKYGALFSLELRRVINTGKYVILPVFLDTPEEKEQYLKIEGCDGVLCDFDKFKEITSKYLLSEAEWRKLCDFDENGPIDTSAVD